MCLLFKYHPKLPPLGILSLSFTRTSLWQVFSHNDQNWLQSLNFTLRVHCMSRKKPSRNSPHRFCYWMAQQSMEHWNSYRHLTQRSFLLTLLFFSRVGFVCRLLTTKFRIFTIQSTHHTSIERVIECVRAMDVRKSLNENINGKERC